MTFPPPAHNFPNLSKLDQAVAGAVEALRKPAGRSRLPVAIQTAALEEAPDDRARLADLLQRGVALWKLPAERRQRGNLSPEDLRALEVVYIVYGRPAIPIRDNQFVRPPAGWELLDAFRDSHEDGLLSVGRIERRTAAGVTLCGTGFLLGPDLVMTAGHVVDKFYTPNVAHPPAGMQLVDAWIDWRAESERPNAKAQFRITEVAWRHPAEDVALLRLSHEGAIPEKTSLPDPLPLRSIAPTNPLDGTYAVVVGYPLRGGEEYVSTETLETIFPGLLGTKRLQPGKIGAPAWTENNLIAHDCSTLGGNSGGPLFLLQQPTPVVVGIHCSGNANEANYAIPTWIIAADLPAQLVATGIQLLSDPWTRPEHP